MKALSYTLKLYQRLRVRYNTQVNNTSSKKIILFILDDFHYGGLTSQVNSYLRHHRSKGYHTIVIGEEGQTLIDVQYYKKCKVIFLPKSPYSERHTNLISYLVYRIHFLIKFAKAYRSIQQKEHIHAMHFNLTWAPLAILLLCPSVYKYPRIITFYGDIALEHKSRIGEVAGLNAIKLYAKVWGLTFCQWLSIALSSKVIVPSQYAKNLVKKRFLTRDKKIIVLPGVIYKNDYSKPKSLEKNPYSNRKQIHLLNISRFENRKGHDILLRAVNILINKGYKIHLTLSGPISGEIFPLLQVFEQLHLNWYVTLLHVSSFKEKLVLMRHADLFIVPSRELETFGLTIIESLAAGTPVVGTPIGAIPETLSLVDKRLIAKSTQPIDIANTIEWYINLSEHEKKKLKIKCKDIALRYFDSENVYKKLEELYSR